MADEILGNCYELITEVALSDYSSTIQSGEDIFFMKNRFESESYWTSYVDEVGLMKNELGL